MISNQTLDFTATAAMLGGNWLQLAHVRRLVVDAEIMSQIRALCSADEATIRQIQAERGYCLETIRARLAAGSSLDDIAAGQAAPRPLRSLDEVFAALAQFGAKE